ncbi:hypothetical protein MASR2M74_28170 [Paracoccaceae bacterium]
MLRRARPDEAGFVRALWTAPQNALWLDPPEADQIEDALDAGHLLIWDTGTPSGFAALTEWHPGVWSLREFAVTAPGLGRPFLRAVLTEMFGPLGAHRVGLDVTADNHRALRFFEQAGFQREGVWRECWQRPAGDWVDCVFLAMLNREWRP